ncbi:MAG: hypothetical protein ACM3PP_04635 [Candidatus Saccharibacteria bacterium]
MPWCPKCRVEYREGFKECSDCQVDLVDKLPEIDLPSPENWVLLGTFNSEIEIVESLLTANGIEFVRGQDGLYVREDQAADAKAILEAEPEEYAFDGDEDEETWICVADIPASVDSCEVEELLLEKGIAIIREIYVREDQVEEARDLLKNHSFDFEFEIYEE